MKYLDIGCGNNKYIGAIGMDRVKLPGVDIVHDMESFPYPFEDNTFDKVIMQHVLEHVSKENMNNIKIIEEIYRILKPGGLLKVEVPIGQWFHFDPTHKNYVGRWYWSYFSEDFPLNYYTHARFELMESKVVGLHCVKGIEMFTPFLDKLYQITPNGIERLINFLNVDVAIKYELKKVGK
jgi:predicted SAM-dependent methyltransferase